MSDPHDSPIRINASIPELRKKIAEILAIPDIGEQQSAMIRYMVELGTGNTAPDATDDAEIGGEVKKTYGDTPQALRLNAFTAYAMGLKAVPISVKGRL